MEQCLFCQKVLHLFGGVLQLRCFIFLLMRKMKTVLRIILSGVAIAIAAWLTPGVEVDSLWAAILAGIVICLVNGFLGTILRFLTLPLNWLTLGLVSFIISVLMIMLASAIVPGFSTGGFLGTAVFALVLSLVNMVLGVKKKD